jgi:GxxExxY protein
MESAKMHENEVSGRIIGCAIEVHRALGPGLLESAYEECLAAEMEAQGLRFERQKAVPLLYRSVKLDCGYRVDFLVEDKVVVDLKAIELVPPVMYAQVLTYVRLLDKRLGLLINFHVEQLTKGIKRIVNNLV